MFGIAFGTHQLFQGEHTHPGRGAKEQHGHEPASRFIGGTTGTHQPSERIDEENPRYRQPYTEDQRSIDGERGNCGNAGGVAFTQQSCRKSGCAHPEKPRQRGNDAYHREPEDKRGKVFNRAKVPHEIGIHHVVDGGDRQPGCHGDTQGKQGAHHRGVFEEVDISGVFTQVVLMKHFTGKLVCTRRRCGIPGNLCFWYTEMLGLGHGVPPYRVMVGERRRRANAWSIGI